MKQEKRLHYLKMGKRHWELFVVLILLVLGFLVFFPRFLGAKTLANTLLGGDEQEGIMNIEDNTIKPANEPRSMAQDEINVQLNVTPQ